MWVGSKLWLGHYGSGWYPAGIVLLVYAGVVLSDYVRRQAVCSYTVAIGCCLRLSQSDQRSPLCPPPPHHKNLALTCLHSCRHNP